MSHREAQLRSRTARERRKPRSSATACNCAKSRKPSASISPRKASSEITLRLPKSQGVTGEKLLEQLERRLDNVSSASALRISRRQARQLVRHGHVLVNGKKVNIPSYEVSVGEEIAIRESSHKVPILEIAKEFASHKPSPAWLEVDRDAYKGRVTALPKREDIQLPVNEQLIVELYSK